MNKCKGIIGYLFGHKMDNFLIKSTPPGELNVKGYITVDEMVRLTNAQTIKEYKLCCVRCGKEPAKEAE